MGKKDKGRRDYLGAIKSLSYLLLYDENNIDLLALGVVQYLKSLSYTDFEDIGAFRRVISSYGPLCLRGSVLKLFDARNTVAHYLGTQLYHDTVETKADLIKEAARSIVSFECKVRAETDIQRKHSIIIDYWGYDRNIDNNGNII